jgi:hypothetical protein
MTGHDHSAPDDKDLIDGTDEVDPVEKQRIRYNPSSTPTKSSEGERIRYNPGRITDDT